MKGIAINETKDGFVLDCSVTMAWCFDDEVTPYTDRIRDSLAGVGAVVPCLWPIEVANVMIVGLPMACLDGGLKVAAQTAGVRLYTGQ